MTTIEKNLLIEHMALKYRRIFVAAFKSVRPDFKGDSVLFLNMMGLNKVHTSLFCEKLGQLLSGNSPDVEELVEKLFDCRDVQVKRISPTRVSTEKERCNDLLTLQDMQMHDLQMTFPHFRQTFKDLKNELVRRSLDSMGKTFDIYSEEAKNFYEDHVLEFSFKYHFDNLGLCSFFAFNRCNSALRANKFLWRDAIYFCAQQSSVISREKIVRRVEISEWTALLIKYLDNGGILTEDPKKNNKIREDIIDNEARSVPIQICQTLSDTTYLISTLKVPNIHGLLEVFRGLALNTQADESQDTWRTAVELLLPIRGMGLALAQNAIKDLFLWDWNLRKRNFFELSDDVVGQTGKADRHVKKCLALLTQPKLIEALNKLNLGYRSFRESQAEFILKNSGPFDSWKSNYVHFIHALCQSADIAPLELDRVCFGLMAGQISTRSGGIGIVTPNLNELRELIAK